MDDLDAITEKELLLEIYKETRWVARYLAALCVLAILTIGAVVLTRADDNANRQARDLVECTTTGTC